MDNDTGLRSVFVRPSMPLHAVDENKQCAANKQGAQIYHQQTSSLKKTVTDIRINMFVPLVLFFYWCLQTVLMDILRISYKPYYSILMWELSHYLTYTKRTNEALTENKPSGYRIFKSFYLGCVSWEFRFSTDSESQSLNINLWLSWTGYFNDNDLNIAVHFYLNLAVKTGTDEGISFLFFYSSHYIVVGPFGHKKPLTPVVLGSRPANSWCHSGISFPGWAGSLTVKMQRTGLKLGSSSEPALEQTWWKRGIVCNKKFT